MVSPCPDKTTPFYLQSPTTSELPTLKPRSLFSDSHCPLKLGCWNTRGWPLDSQFRSRVIHSLDLDLIGICETFLQENNEIHLKGYTWIGNNHKQISKRAICGSGEVGLLVKDTVFHKFTVSVLDNKSEGILWVLLLDQASQHSISLWSAIYLPVIHQEVTSHLNFSMSSLPWVLGGAASRVTLFGTESATASRSMSARESMRALKSPQMHNRPESWYFETCSLRLLSLSEM